MHVSRLWPVAVVAAGVIAGCGSSSSSSHSATSSGAPAAATTSATSATPGGYGAYGQSSTATAAPAQTSTTPVALVATKQSKLGTILAFGPKRLTVYLFEADHGRASACSGACARFWPPVTGTPKAIGGASAGALGTIMRADGSHQVTYHGRPLYLFVKDKDAGDTHGEGVVAFGAGWFALRPTGAKVGTT